jgi:hypothetical protein
LRLPFIQVTQETWSKARMLSGLLAIPERECLGLILDLWAWGLELGPQDEAPTGVCDNPRAVTMLAGALRFQGSSAELANALSDVGLMEALESGGIRIRGLDRYKRTWKRNRVGKSAETDAEPTPSASVSDTKPTNPDAKPTHQTQTQTQKKIKTKEEEPNPISAMGSLRLPIDAKPERRKEPAPLKPGFKPGEVFFLWAQGEREQQAGLIPELSLDPPDTEAWFAEASAVVGSLDRLKGTYNAFLVDPFWMKNRNRWAQFRKKWRDFVPPAEAPAPPVPACRVCASTANVSGGWCSPCGVAWQNSDAAREVITADDPNALIEAWVSGRKEAA